MWIRNILWTQVIALEGDLPHREPCTCGSRSSGVAEMALTGSARGRGPSLRAVTAALHRLPSQPGSLPHKPSLVVALLLIEEGICKWIPSWGSEGRVNHFLPKKPRRGPPFPDMGQDEPSRAAGDSGETLAHPLQRSRERLELCWPQPPPSSP